MSWQYLAKAVYSGAVAFIGQVAIILVDDAVIADITQGQWAVIAGFTLAAFGGVLGLQELPAKVATGIR